MVCSAMAIRAVVTASVPVGAALIHESPMAVQPVIASPSAGPFSEYEEFAWAGYEYTRANREPNLYSRQEIQGAQREAWNTWWRNIREYFGGMRPEAAREAAFQAGANVRPAWLADP